MGTYPALPFWGAFAGSALALLGSLLFVSPFLNAAFVLPKLLALAAGAGLAGACLCWGSRRGLLHPASSPLHGPIVACLGAATVSAALSDDPFVSITGLYNFHAYGLLALWLYAALHFSESWSGAQKRREAILRVLLIGCAAAGVLGLISRAGISPFEGVSQTLKDGRVFSTQGSPVYLGACLLLAMPAALHFSLSKRSTDRLLGLLGGGLAGGGLLLTLTRGAWLGAIAGCLAYLFLSGRLRFWELGRRRSAWLALGLGLLVVCGGYWAGRRRPVALSDSARAHLWRSALDIFAAHPLLGVGPDGFGAALRRYKTSDFVRVSGPGRLQANAHNDLLQALATTGLLGLAAYLWFLWRLVAAAARALGEAEGRGAAAAAAGALLGLFVFAKFNPTPLGSLAAAALLCASLGSRTGGKEEPLAPWLPAAAFSLSLAAFWFVCRLTLADRHLRSALIYAAVGDPRAELEFGEAQRWNPWETEFRMARSKHLHARAQSLGDPARRRELYEEAVAIGRESLRLRPAQLDSYQIYGNSLLLSTLDGGPNRLAEAEAALDHAQNLDPSFTPLLANRIRLAQLTGKTGKRDELQALYDRILATAGRE